MAISTGRSKTTPTIFVHTLDLSCKCGYIIDVPDEVSLQKGQVWCESCETTLEVSKSLAEKYNKMS